MPLSFAYIFIKKEKENHMKKPTTTQLLNLAVTGLTLLGMVLSSKAQEHEMQELKEEIKMELKEEKKCD